MTEIKQLQLSDLKKGMIVSEKELKNIVDTHIVLINAKIIDNDILGEIGFIGSKLNKESDALNQLNTNVADIYNSKFDAEDDVNYDE